MRALNASMWTACLELIHQVFGAVPIDELTQQNEINSDTKITAMDLLLTVGSQGTLHYGGLQFNAVSFLNMDSSQT